MIVNNAPKACMIKEALVSPWLLRSLTIETDPNPMSRLGTNNIESRNGASEYFVLNKK